MAGTDFHTRLPNDHADAVEKYAEEHDVTKSEVLRRAVKHFLDEEGYLTIETAASVSPEMTTLGRYGTTGAFLSLALGIAFALIGPAAIAFLAIGAAIGTATAFIQRSGVLERFTDRLTSELGWFDG